MLFGWCVWHGRFGGFPVWLGLLVVIVWLLCWWSEFVLVNSVGIAVSFCACVFVVWLALFTVSGGLIVLVLLFVAVDCSGSLGGGLNLWFGYCGGYC